MKSYVQRKVEKYVIEHSGEWLYRTTGDLGRSEENGKAIQTGIPGIVWVRVANGQEVKAYNKVAASIWNTHVLLGVSKSLPGYWQIIEVRGVYLAPPGGINTLVNHAQQHFMTGVDPVFIDNKQVLPLSILVVPTAAFTVRVYEGIFRSTDGWTRVRSTGSVSNPDIVLSSYVPDTGALYIAIVSDADGTLSVVEGVPFEAKEFATDSDIPVPDAGFYMLGWILLYESMPTLLNSHVGKPSSMATDYGSVSEIPTTYYDQYVYEVDDDGRGFILIVDGIAVVEPLPTHL